MRPLLNRLRARLLASSCGALLAIAASPTHAADNEIRLVRQFGIHYLPLIVMESEKLIEKHAQASGLPAMKVQWATISGGASVNDALLSGAVDFSAGGVGPLIVLWDKSAGGKGDVKAIAAVSDVPMTLTSRNPAIKGIEDFTEKDRIALPAVKTSMQAVTLQMAATKKWGIASYERLDKFTVAMRHPDAAAALMSGKTEINSHFTAAPYDFEELRTPGIHQVLDSYDVYGGPATLIVLYTTKKYMEANPKIAPVVLSAMAEAMEMIARDKPKAARIYLDITKEKTAVDDLVAMLNNPKVAFRLQPSATFPVAEFLHSTGRVKNKAESWKDLFFPIAHTLKGADPPMSTTLLDVRGVSLQYKTRDHLVTATYQVDFQVDHSDRFVLLGPSGCGKSTLLKAVGGYMTPVEGSILLKGKAITGPGPDRVMVFQEFDQLLPWKTVRQNVEFALTSSKRLTAGAARERALHYIDKVNLSKFADSYPHTLSGGMKQRVAIARGMAMEPDILLMDEPFAALDALTRRKMQDELLQLWQDTRFTVIFVTHSIPEAVLIGNRILLLSPHPGQVKAELNSNGTDEIDPVSGKPLSQRIHEMLFENEVENADHEPDHHHA